MDYRVFRVTVTAPIDGGTAERSYDVQVRADEDDIMSNGTMSELVRDALCAAIAQNVSTSHTFTDVVNVA